MLKLNETAVQKMKLHAVRTYPEECCGVLLGRDAGDFKEVCDVLEVRNQGAENRERRFLISPEDYQRAERLARREGVEIVGFYHSHPDHPATPSQFDLDHALPFWSYLIVSVEGGQPASVASWVLKEDRSQFDQERTEVFEGELVHRCTGLKDHKEGRVKI
jgi:proteasome lid subunit RPN8/RPN11